MLLPRDGGQAKIPAVAMTNEEERALRDRLAPLLRHPRAPAGEIRPLLPPPVSTFIKTKRLKKGTLSLRNKSLLIGTHPPPNTPPYLFPSFRAGKTARGRAPP